MAEQVTISVITITRDNLAGLRRTRASVVTQANCSLEHIVIDGASSDGTKAWLEEQESVTWRSEPDRGRYDAMNKGAGLAKGALLWFLHAGDTFADSKVVARVSTDWQQRHWKWAYGCARLVDAAGSLVGANAPIPFKLRLLELGKLVIPHQAACFETGFFAELGGYDVEFGIAADQLFMLRAAHESPPAVIAEFLCDFDLGGAGSARSPFQHYRDAALARKAVGIHSTRRDAGTDVALTGLLVAAETIKRFGARRLQKSS